MACVGPAAGAHRSGWHHPPALPGLPLLFAGLWLAAWADGYQHVSGATLGWLAGLTALGMAMDALAGWLGAAPMAPSKAGTVGAADWRHGRAVVWLARLAAGALLGAVAGEWLARRDARRAVARWAWPRWWAGAGHAGQDWLRAGDVAGLCLGVVDVARRHTARQAGGQGQRQRPARAALECGAHGLAHLTTFNATILAGHERLCHKAEEGFVAARRAAHKTQRSDPGWRTTADSNG